MIEINLLPEELKAIGRRKKAGLVIDLKYLVYLLLSILGLIICIHIYLTVFIVIKNNQLRLLNNKWHSLEPQRKIWEEFNNEYAMFSQDARDIQQLTEERIIWSEKLNKLSSNLPSGIWFNEISIQQNDLILGGSVVSLEKEEMALIKKFIDSLKSDPGFFRDFSGLELRSAQKKTIGTYEVVDFILAAALKPAKISAQDKKAGEDKKAK